MIALHREPFVTVQKRGTITVNASAHAAVGEPDAVELLLDRNDHVLGLRPRDVDVGRLLSVELTGPFEVVSKPTSSAR